MVVGIPQGFSALLHDPDLPILHLLPLVDENLDCCNVLEHGVVWPSQLAAAREAGDGSQEPAHTGEDREAGVSGFFLESFCLMAACRALSTYYAVCLPYFHTVSWVLLTPLQQRLIHFSCVLSFSAHGRRYIPFSNLAWSDVRVHGI